MPIFVKAYRRAKAVVRAYTRSGNKKGSKPLGYAAEMNVTKARKASRRSQKIRDARDKALGMRAYGGKFGGLK